MISIKYSKTVLHLIAMILILLGVILYSLMNFDKAHAYPITTNALLVNDRTTLRVCFATDQFLTTRMIEISDRLFTALDQVRQYKGTDWLPAGFQEKTPIPESNCQVRIPSKQMLGFESLGPGLTDKPGPFRSVILVLSETSANRVLENKNADFATYELMQISDHVAVEVTSALVVRESSLENPEFIETYLPVALGLEPVTEFKRPAEEPIPSGK
ncbi:MAG: hypothetical protein IT313_11100 [Anaerolineales bacterium]|nr:hypothetical protein [Anaerolineales bacterium]